MRVIGWSILGVLLAWTIVLYRPLLSQGQSAFVYEDQVTIQQNPMVLGMQPISLSTARWATWTSYRIDAWRSGQTSAFHRTNLVLHLLVGILIYGLMRRWGASEAIALCGAAASLLHPLTVESVAYITARSELVCALGVLLALWCVPVRGEWTALRLVGVLLATYLAIGGKEAGLLTPALVWMVKPLPKWTLIVAGLFGALVVYRLYDHHTVLGQGPYPPVRAFALQCVALLHGLRLIVWPDGLSVDADIAAASKTWQVLAVLIVGSACLVYYEVRLTAPRVAFALAWIGITLGPRLVADSWEFINEHQFYVPLIGLVLACAIPLEEDPLVAAGRNAWLATFDGHPFCQNLSLGAGDETC